MSTKRTKFEFVNDHYQHTFRSSKDSLDKSLKQAIETTQKMRNIFTDINQRLHSDIDKQLRLHSERCSYDTLKALATFNLKDCSYSGAWYGSALTSHTQQWPSKFDIEETNPSCLQELQIAEIEYYAPAKYNIFAMKIKLSDGRESPLLGDYYYDNPFV